MYGKHINKIFLGSSVKSHPQLITISWVGGSLNNENFASKYFNQITPLPSPTHTKIQEGGIQGTHTNKHLSLRARISTLCLEWKSFSPQYRLIKIFHNFNYTSIVTRRCSACIYTQTEITTTSTIHKYYFYYFYYNIVNLILKAHTHTHTNNILVMCMTIWNTEKYCGIIIRWRDDEMCAS